MNEEKVIALLNSYNREAAKLEGKACVNVLFKNLGASELLTAMGYEVIAKEEAGYNPSKVIAIRKKDNPEDKADDTISQLDDIVCDFYGSKGYKVLDRDWECLAGKADVVQDGDTIVFIKLKVRPGGRNLPEENMTAKKRKAFERIAIEYFLAHDLPSSDVRFDIISIVIPGGGEVFLRHHKDVLVSGE